jgi:hypothetical protein
LGVDQELPLKPAFAAEHHIEKALANFHKLKLRKSAAVSKFEDHQNRKLDDLRASLRLGGQLSGHSFASFGARSRIAG